MDNFSLTGESFPPPLDSFDRNHLESRNLTFYSTNLGDVEGTGTELVIKTSGDTVMGHSYYYYCIASAAK